MSTVPASLSISKVSCSHEPDCIMIQINECGRIMKIAVAPEQFALALTGLSERPCQFSEFMRVNRHPRD